MKVHTDADLEFVNVLVCGESGTGKTSFASTAPRSLYVAFESQARVVVRQRQRSSGIGDCVGIITPEKAEDLRAIVRAFRGNRAEPFRVVGADGSVVFEAEDWPLTLVIDSVTDAVKMIQEEIDTRVRLELASDGFPDRNMRRRGAYKEESERMFRGVRDVPAHVIWLAILDEGVDEASDGSKIRYAGPQLLAKSHRSALMQTTNIAGVSRRRVHPPEKDPKTGEVVGEPRIEYAVQLVGPTYLPLKEFRPLADVEVPDFSSWLSRIFGEAPNDEPND